MVTCPACGTGFEGPVNFCSQCATPLSTSPLRQEYKIVTIAFCDVVKSTALGRRLAPLAFSQVMERYGETVRQVLGGPGTSIGKRHGDGFMAAFGVPELREDDTLRAVRSANELRGAIADLSAELQREHGVELQVRMGINTGEVLVKGAGTLEEEITGDAVTVARRLEQAAPAGQILLGEETYKLVDDAVEAEPAEQLIVEGLPGEQSTWRLLEVFPGRKERSLAPLVGRGLEKELLGSLFARAVDEQSAHLVMLLGPGGVGKSRLTDEFALQLGERATVLRTKCLQMGKSVTVWPMVEIIRNAADIKPVDSPEAARARVAHLLRTDERGELVTERIAQMLGFGHSTELPEGTLWALQHVLEAVARRRPLVVIVDDLQWADAILLDVVEHLAVHLHSVPVLLVCIARPDELFEHRDGWPVKVTNALSLKLSPLRIGEGETLVEYLLGAKVAPEVQALVAQSAQGYPLIIEEMVANLRDEERLESVDGRWTLRSKPAEVRDRRAGSVPTMIQALLQAKLERLDPRGLGIVEAASVVGERFHMGDVEALSDGVSPEDIEMGIEELIRLDLIQLDHSPASFPLPPNSGAGYKFRHTMIQAVAYGRMPDDRRAAYHEQYAEWLAAHTKDRPHQFDELVSHHFHEAYRYLSKVYPRDQGTADVGRRAGERYAEAGRRAAIRGDTGLVRSWLGQAVRLLPDDHPERRRALPALADAQQASGKLDEAASSYRELAKSATAVGDEGLAMHATIGRLRLMVLGDPMRLLDEGRDQVELAIPVFDRLGDNQGLAKTWHLLAYLDWSRGRLSVATASAEKARYFAREAADPYWEATALSLTCLILYWGSAPLDEVERRNQEALAEAQRRGMRSLEATALTVLARVAALRRDRDEARRLVDEANSITSDLGESLTQAADCITQALIELPEGDLAAAQDLLVSGYQQLEEMGGTRPRANVAAMLARVLLLRGRSEEAEEYARICERIAPPDQIDAQVKWRSLRGIILARTGDFAEAEQLAREAVTLADKTDQLDSRAEARLDLAEVLRLDGRRREAARALGRAIDLYREKGNEVGEAYARQMMSGVGQRPGLPLDPEEGAQGPEPDRQQ
jgi:class 3 adenylate cyclase/tetratricopeptide (TPR) repeat protein